VPAPLVPIAAIAGFGLIIVVVSRLNESRPVDVGGLFPVHGRSEWPRGVQEPDAPRFAIDHADRLGRSEPTVEEIPTIESTAPRRESVTSRIHRFAPNRQP
jgi:hypothetical protein